MKRILLFLSLIISLIGYAQTQFHDTKGNIEVDGGGQLQFSMPIALPPGVKTAAPQINLTYTSGSGNGVAGYGWNLSGLTAIARVSKNIEKDNFVTGIKSDYSDYYTFNGKRLILKSGEYGKDGAEYVTETYSNVKIQSFGSITGKPWQGPMYWMVTFEDGSQAWYGTIPNGNVANTDLQYNIAKWRNAQGNYITYTYDQPTISSDNITIIKNISWGGNETLNKAHFNSIEFNYKNRLLNETAYHQGNKHVQSKIIDNIVVSASNAQFKKYQVEYTTGTTSYEFVSKVTEFNAANEPANPVTFGYNPGLPGSEEILYPYNITNFNTKKYADFDRDGIADFIEFVSAGDIKFKSSVYLNAPSVSLQYDATKFTANDFKNAIPITFKKNNIVSSRVGIVIPVVKNTAVSHKKDYEFQIYSVNLQTNTLDFEYSKTIENDQYNPLNVDDDFEICSSTSAPVIKEAESYDFNGDGIQELIFKFQVNRLCGSPTGPTGPTGPEFNSQTSNSSTEMFSEMSSAILQQQMGSNNTELGYEEEPEPENIAPGQYFKINTGYILIDLDQDLAVPDSVYKFGTASPTSYMRLADLNGDGIQEFIVQSGSQLTQVLNIRRDLSNVYSQEPVGNFTGQNFGNSQYAGMLIGDFNGDSKVDLLVPQANESYNWDLYISTGVAFNKYYISNFILYQSEYKELHSEVHNTFFESGCQIKHIRTMQYQVSDVDGDGKSDIIVANLLLKDHQWNAHRSEESTTVTTVVYSINKLEGSNNKAIIYNPSFPGPFGSSSILLVNTDNPNSITTNSDVNFFKTRYWFKQFSEKVIPFGILSFTREQQQIIMTGKPVDCQGSECDQNYVLHYNYPFVSKLARVAHIKQADIVTQIDYQELNPALFPNFYKATQTVSYPYMELDKVPQSIIVSKMTDYLPAGIKVQDFRYRGLISNFHGKGMTGFRQFARSSPYNPSNTNTIIWSGMEVDPMNDNLPLKEWTIRTTDENNIFPTNISENNSQLLTFKQSIYQKDKLINGQIVTGAISPTDKAKVVSAVFPSSAKEKNFLINTLTTTAISYGDYYFPSSNTTTVNNGYAVNTSSFEYFHNPSGTGPDYYFGRLKNKQNIIQAYGDTKASKEEYTYDNNLLKTSKSWNRDNSGYILETFNYDGFGNVTQKTTSNSVDSQVENSAAEYDSKGRFVLKKTDNLGLETNFNYNDWGLLLTTTDPLANTVTNTYDNWGKVQNSLHNLTGLTTYQYDKDNNFNIVITQYEADGNISKNYTNKLGQKYKTSAKAFDQNQYVSKDTTYDILGRKTGESEPYFEGQGASQWNVIAYDDTFYPAKTTTTSFNGKQVESSFTGFITTLVELTGYNRTTSKVQDALGNVITSTDKGGTIVFKYNAIGQQVLATYQTNKVSTKYDVWDRKSEFNDPSNGIYKYEYNGIGQIKKLISPKGNKQYIYNALGQLITQNENSSDGISTNKSITITYDQLGRVTSKAGTSNGKPYSSNIEFDQYGRLKSLTEYSNGKSFSQRNIVYDNISRIDTYNKSLRSGPITTQVTIKNVYNPWNGELYQVKDNTSGNVLWQLQQSNAKGQILSAKLGASTITNLFDNNGFLISTNHSSQIKPGILQVNYSFNAIKNELNSRSTGGDFSISETFTYDDNNRLISWTNPRTGQLSGNTYDAQGRITYNDQLGTVKFENPSKLYQPSSIDLNAAGQQNYTNDLLQTVTYNENNDPIFLNGVKGDVRFEYGLTSMRQQVTYGGNFAANGDGKFTKFYSEDGSFEVIKDNATGQEKHLLYIGGSPYESNIVFIKNYNETTGSYKFLHKDYIGSILAISDMAGNKLEQRHYDAWGNFTHLQIGSGVIITNKNTIDSTSLILERGYTSHEHFAEVGIIHMNGRLYDPLLRRFLNADMNIQDMYNTQIYNKYGYVMNNPLLYNDPSGEIFQLIPIASAIVIGAIIGGAGYLISTLITGAKFTLMGFFKATFFGAVSGAVTFGIGNIFSTVVAGVQKATVLADSLGKVGSAFMQAGVHAVAQGALSLMQGGDISSAGMAAITGLVTSGFMSGFGAIAPETAKSLGTSLAVGALVGGATQKLAGGNFWQGAVIGAIVAGLNHGLHTMEANNQIRDALSDPDGVPVATVENINSIKAEVHGLFNESMRKYESSASVKIDLTTNSDFAAETKSIGGIGADTGKIGKVGITYFKKAFLSNYALGKAILHEYYHVADYYSGRATTYFLNYRKKYDAPKSAILLKDHIEIRAYKFIFDLGDSSSVYKK